MARTLFPTQETLHPKHSTFKIGHKKAKDVGKECLICICKKNQGLSETVVKDVQDARRVFLTELRTLRNVRRGKKKDKRRKRADFACRNNFSRRDDEESRTSGTRGGGQTNGLEIWFSLVLLVIGL